MGRTRRQTKKTGFCCFFQNNLCVLFFNGLAVYIYRAGNLCGEWSPQAYRTPQPVGWHGAA
jgi:hypothetical protein